MRTIARLGPVPKRTRNTFLELYLRGDHIRQETGDDLALIDAPADAIVSRVLPSTDRYGEAEYLVNRRRLRHVTVVARYSELPLGTPPPFAQL